MHKLLKNAPQKVAEDLVGKTIRVGSKRGTITKCLARTESDNATWLVTRPLFGSNPVDVYVAPYRGSHLLFLRTGARNTCVRIDGILLSDGTKCNGPGQVCKAFKLNGEKTGNVEIDEAGLNLIFS